jgi:hypothetical protein
LGRAYTLYAVMRMMTLHEVEHQAQVMALLQQMP